MQIRRNNRGASAVALLAALALVPPAAGQSGGAATPEQQSGAAPVDPGFVLSARRGVFVGRELRVKGVLPQAARRTVRIDSLDASGLWAPVGTSEADDRGAFVATWVPASAGRFTVRAVVDGGEARSASTSARSSVPRAVTVYRPAVATWYGPGFFGRRTACGQRLGRSTLGVAHRRLPCGTPVAVAHGRRSIVVPVIDRGPFARGVHYDLTAATARRLGVTATSPVGVAPLN